MSDYIVKRLGPFLFKHKKHLFRPFEPVNTFAMEKIMRAGLAAHGLEVGDDEPICMRCCFPQSFPSHIKPEQKRTTRTDIVHASVVKTVKRRTERKRKGLF